MCCEFNSNEEAPLQEIFQNFRGRQWQRLGSQFENIRNFSNLQLTSALAFGHRFSQHSAPIEPKLWKACLQILKSSKHCTPCIWMAILRVRISIFSSIFCVLISCSILSLISQYNPGF
jgi:hypothetical protein